MSLSSTQLNKLRSLEVPFCPQAWHGLPDGIPDVIHELVDLDLAELNDGVYWFVRLTEQGRAVCIQSYKEEQVN